MTNTINIRILFALLFIFITAMVVKTTIAGEEDHSGHDHANTGEFQVGQHYHNISPAVSTNVSTGKVEVLELFWYGCPHCFEFEKFLKDWKQNKAENVEFIRMPAVLNRGWIPHARAFYALETMGEIERLHPIIFEAIHTQGRRLRDMDSMARFFSQHGIDPDEFKKAYDSFYVEAKVKRSNQLVREYGSSAVPTVIINGKYRTSAGDAGGYERLLQLIDHLTEQEANLVAETATSE